MLQILDEFRDPADHLALDEALLVAADAGESVECIRFWEFTQPIVIAGRSTRVSEEINLPFCEAHGIPVMRRCSGGASVVGGPGCLMYSIVLSLAGDESLRKIDVAHTHVMTLLLTALQFQVTHAQWQGICDLTWKNRKCSGNSLKIGRHHLLYHGTILYQMDLQLISKALALAPRQPEYRASREHRDFVTNVPIDPSQFIQDAKQVFAVNEVAHSDRFGERIRVLREQRYDVHAWHYRH